MDTKSLPPLPGFVTAYNGATIRQIFEAYYYLRPEKLETQKSPFNVPHNGKKLFLRHVDNFIIRAKDVKAEDKYLLLDEIIRTELYTVDTSPLCPMLFGWRVDKADKYGLKSYRLYPDGAKDERHKEKVVRTTRENMQVLADLYGLENLRFHTKNFPHLEGKSIYDSAVITEMVEAVRKIVGTYGAVWTAEIGISQNPHIHFVTLGKVKRGGKPVQSWRGGLDGLAQYFCKPSDGALCIPDRESKQRLTKAQLFELREAGAERLLQAQALGRLPRSRGFIPPQ